MDVLAPFVPMMLGVAGGAIAMLLDAWGRRAESVLCAVSGLSLGAIAAGLMSSAPASAARLGSGGEYSAIVFACLFLGAAALAGAFRTLAAGPDGARTAALAAFAASSAALLSVSTDLLLLFLSVEALSLCGYGLVALSDTDRAREAAMKWFVQGSVATALLIIGIGVLVSRTDGSLSYAALGVAASVPAASGPLAIGLVLVISALAFKAGAFPFHSWMPDALETAPPAASAVLASAGKVGPLAAAVWLTTAVAGSTGDRILPVLALVAVTSIVFGNLAALRQRSLARMLAYAAIAQIGYAFVGLSMAGGREGALLFVVLYGLASLGSFLFIVALGEREPGWDGSIAGMAGLGRRSPVLAASLAAIMLSMTGIPLTAGFWGKFVVFGAAATGGYLWLAIAGVLGSVVSFGYYGGVLRSAFMDEANPAATVGKAPRADATAPAKGFATAAVALIAVAIVLIGVAPLVVRAVSIGPLR